MLLNRRIEYFCVGALAAAVLLLEGALTRFLAVAQFYHFAFLVVSLALLGFGASGALLSLFPHWYSMNSDGQENLGRLLAVSGVGFAASVGLLFFTVNLLPFDSYSITWDRRQVLYFILYYLVLTIPFIFAGMGIGGVLSNRADESNVVYAVNLLGSAIGILSALLVMQFSGVPGALLASALIGLSAGIVRYKAQRKLFRYSFLGILSLGFVALGLLTWVNLGGRTDIFITISPYKGLAYARRIPGSENLFGKWNAISRLDVIAQASTRVMPGLSYAYTETPPLQSGMALDADNLQPITQVHPDEFEAAEYLPESFGFQIKPMARALVIDPGAGLGILQALAGGASQVTGVVNNPLILEAVADTASETDPYKHQYVKSVIESSRVFLGSKGERYDIIFVPLIDPYRPVASGAYSLAETYTLTVEAFTDVLLRLSEDGVFVITRWLQTPPSEEIRAMATVLEALAKLNIKSPGEKIVAYRSIQTMTILVKPSGWIESELSALREFADSRRFDLIWAPDIKPEELNRYNRMAEPVYYQDISDLLIVSDRDEYYAEHSFAVQPATDDHPFFFHFFKWTQTPQIMATLGRVWQPFGGSGYFVLLALLILVSGFSVILIVLPVVIKNRTPHDPLNPTGTEHNKSTPASRWRVFVYFGSIGLAFLFIEIPLIQKGILFFGHPIYAFTIVVISILLFSSIGSAISDKDWLPKRWAFILLVGLALITPILIILFQQFALGMPVGLRIMLFVIGLAPLGLLMGMPFPLGLSWLERSRTKQTPWAWAVNGCASVIAAVLAAILSLSYGFTLVFILGAFFYGIAGIIAMDFWGKRKPVSGLL